MHGIYTYMHGWFWWIQWVKSWWISRCWNCPNPPKNRHTNLFTVPVFCWCWFQGVILNGTKILGGGSNKAGVHGSNFGEMSFQKSALFGLVIYSAPLNKERFLSVSLFLMKISMEWMILNGCIFHKWNEREKFECLKSLTQSPFFVLEGILFKKLFDSFRR